MVSILVEFGLHYLIIGAAEILINQFSWSAAQWAGQPNLRGAGILENKEGLS